METKKVDMAYTGNDCCSPCGFYDNKYPIGFFLNPKQVEALGIPATVEPETDIEVVATIKIKSVTKREGQQVELYACVTEMGLAQTAAADKTPNAKIAKAYAKGDNDGNGHD